MKTSDLKNLSSGELSARLEETVQEYNKTETAVLGGQEKNHTKLKGLRRMIARLKTFQQQSHDQK